MFRGFTIFRAIEVTDQEVLSSLERDLIDKESIVSHTRFKSLQDKLRTLFRRPELRFGLAALDGDQVLVLNYGAESEHACIFADSRHHTVEEFRGSVYERAVKQGGPLIVEDMRYALLYYIRAILCLEAVNFCLRIVSHMPGSGQSATGIYVEV